LDVVKFKALGVLELIFLLFLHFPLFVLGNKLANLIVIVTILLEATCRCSCPNFLFNVFAICQPKVHAMSIVGFLALLQS
jgi:hypothetical protein